MHGLLDENSRSGIFEGPVWNFYRSSLIRRQQARAGGRQMADEVASVHPAPGDGGRCWVPSSSGKRGRAGVAGPLLSQVVEASALECEAETLSLCKPECNSASVFTQTGMPTNPWTDARTGVRGSGESPPHQHRCISRTGSAPAPASAAAPVSGLVL